MHAVKCSLCGRTALAPSLVAPRCHGSSTKNLLPFSSSQSFTRTYKAPKNPSSHLVRSAYDDIEPVPAATLQSLETVDDIEAEAKWLAGMIRCWLDEEWTPLDIHRELGDAAARVYIELREQGSEEEVGDVILGLAQGLLTFNFRETFVGPFDIANKVAELLMLRQSCDVCCVSEKQKEDIKRWDAVVSGELLQD